MSLLTELFHEPVQVGDVIVDALREPLEDRSAVESWVRYNGPRGGRGWKDTSTGRVAYQEESPGKVGLKSQDRESGGNDRDSAIDTLKAMAKKSGIEDYSSVPSIYERWVEMGMADKMGITADDAKEARRLYDSTKGLAWKTKAPDVKNSKPEWALVPADEFDPRDPEDDGFYYHVTTKPAVKKVLKDGLVPDAGRTMADGYYQDYSKGKVFLTDRGGVEFWKNRIEDHLESQERDADLVVMRIPKSAVGELEIDEAGTRDARVNAYFSKSPVKPRKSGTVQDLASQLKSKYGDALETLDLAEGDGHVELSNVRVSKESQGKGIGGEILKELKQYAASKGKPIVLTAEPDPRKKTALLDFYAKNDFVKPRKKRNYSLPRHSHIWYPPNRSAAESAAVDCGANKKGGGGFQPGNSCSKGSDWRKTEALKDYPESVRKLYDDLPESMRQVEPPGNREAGDNPVSYQMFSINLDTRENPKRLAQNFYHEYAHHLDRFGVDNAKTAAKLTTTPEFKTALDATMKRASKMDLDEYTEKIKGKLKGRDKVGDSLKVENLEAFLNAAQKGSSGRYIGGHSAEYISKYFAEEVFSTGSVALQYGDSDLRRDFPEMWDYFESRMFGDTPWTGGEDKQTDSQNLKAWFGDSKVVDNDGNPLVVYHGTNQAFDEFDTDRIGYNTGNEGHHGYGIYLSLERLEASTYGDNILETYVSMQNPFIPSVENFDLLKRNGADWIDDKINVSMDYDSVHDAIRSIDPIAADLFRSVHDKGYGNGWDEFIAEHPGFDFVNHDGVDLNMVADFTEYLGVKDSDYEPGIPQWVEDDFESLGIADKIKYNQGYRHRPKMHWVTDLGSRSKELTDIIKSLGFDGVISGSEIVVFDPSQIKSATHNNGNFNPKSRKINESVCGADTGPGGKGFGKGNTCGQRDLFGREVKPEKKTLKADNKSGKQKSLFATGGLAGQMNLFADDGIPDDLINKEPERKKTEVKSDDFPVPVKQTESKPFKGWFGNSKVVDENGEPLVVYHGSAKPDITQPEESERREAGIYLTADPEYASGYATSFNEMAGTKLPTGANVFPAYVRMENPKFVLTKPYEMGSVGFTPKLMYDLQAEGYDGLIVGMTDYEYEQGYRTMRDAQEVVVFDISQIKSATGNKGTFDPKKGITEKHVYRVTRKGGRIAVEKSEDHWTRYTGPRGGRGWQNSRGDIAYQDESPGKVGLKSQVKDEVETESHDKSDAVKNKREPSGTDRLVDFAGYRVVALRNPSVDNAVNRLQQLKDEAEGDPFRFAAMRGISDGQNIWLWDAQALLHDDAAKALGLDRVSLATANGLLKFDSEGGIRHIFSRYEDTGSYLPGGRHVATESCRKTNSIRDVSETGGYINEAYVYQYRRDSSEYRYRSAEACKKDRQGRFDFDNDCAAGGRSKDRDDDTGKTSSRKIDASVRRHESRIREHRDFEELIAIGSDGKDVFVKKGEKDHVGFTTEEMDLMAGSPVVIHNHPSGWDYDKDDPRREGNSFSREDIMFAVRLGVGEIRAVTPVYDYSMKIPKDFVSKQMTEMRTVMESARMSLTQDQKDRRDSWTDVWVKKLNGEVGDGEFIARTIVHSALNDANAEVKGVFWSLIKAGSLTTKEAEASHFHQVMQRVSKQFGWTYARTKA